MITNVIVSVFIGMFVLSLLNSLVEVAYNLRNGDNTHSSTWIIPSIFAMLAWFVYHL